MVRSLDISAAGLISFLKIHEDNSRRLLNERDIVRAVDIRSIMVAGRRGFEHYPFLVCFPLPVTHGSGIQRISDQCFG